ncbi:MAG TPA: YciI family protein [Candidatus Polarisedimenticolaceae bacterium]
MRFLLMNKTNAHNEAGLRPPQELIDGVGRSLGEMKRQGVFRDAAGLRQTNLGVRIAVRGGVGTVTPGPFGEDHALPAAICLLRVHTRDEAVGWASRFGAALGDADFEIRPLTEPWDLGFGEKPKDLATTRFMIVAKATAAYEAGELPPPPARAAVAGVIAEMKGAEVFLGAEVMQPGSRSRRVLRRGATAVVLDGPFAESKELVGGYVTLELASMEEALAWAVPYTEVLGECELDVRPLFEVPELGVLNPDPDFG